MCNQQTNCWITQPFFRSHLGRANMKNTNMTDSQELNRFLERKQIGAEACWSNVSGQEGSCSEQSSLCRILLTTLDIYFNLFCSSFQRTEIVRPFEGQNKIKSVTAENKKQQLFVSLCITFLKANVFGWAFLFDFCLFVYMCGVLVWVCVCS